MFIVLGYDVLSDRIRPLVFIARQHRDARIDIGFLSRMGKICVFDRFYIAVYLGNGR